MKNLRSTRTSSSTVTLTLSALVAVLALVAGVLLAGLIAGSGNTIVTVRVWDDKVAEAYKASFAAFHEENPGITVDVTVIPWSQYWTQLDSDIAADRADDIFWVNNSYLPDLADNGSLTDIDALLGARAKNNWDRAVVNEFTRAGALWGVPQLSDAGIAVYYNKELLDAGGIAPESLENLAWNPDPALDSFLPVAKALTRDAAGRTGTDPAFDGSSVNRFGYNAANDLQAILLPSIGSNGGTFQSDGLFTFAEPKSAEAIAYQVALINTHRVAPPAMATSADPDYSRDRFVDGKIALFQSGLYNLPYVFDGAKFEWGVASMPAGPAGRVSVTNGIVAAGNAKTDSPEAMAKVLRWMGSEEGNRFIGSSGAGVPAVISAQQAYFDFWNAKEVDVSRFFEVLANDAPIITPPEASNYSEVEAAYGPILDDVFMGNIEVGAGLQQAQDAANDVLPRK